MFFSNYAELSLKGALGKLFYLIRFTLCVFPIGSIIMVICWAFITASKNWSTIVNNTILILCIVVAVLSIASFVFILFAVLSILRKLETIFTYLYFFITIAAFIFSFVLLSFGNSSHEIDYLSNFNKACGNPTDVELIFPTPTPTPTPEPTPEPPELNPVEYKILEDAQPPEPTPQPTETPQNFSQGDFCRQYWTSWSRKKYIRARTTESKNAFAGIISPWVILFFIEFSLLFVLQPPKITQKKQDAAYVDEDNGLIDENLLQDDPQSQSQTHENDNVQLELDPIFRDEDASDDDGSLTTSNV